MSESLVWIRVIATGAVWEVSQVKAANLLKWQPNDYVIVTPDAKAEAPADAPAGEQVEAPAKPKKK